LARAGCSHPVQPMAYRMQPSTAAEVMTHAIDSVGNPRNRKLHSTRDVGVAGHRGSGRGAESGPGETCDGDRSIQEAHA